MLIQHKPKLTSARNRDKGARESQTCSITQCEVHTVCPRPAKGPPHGQEAHVTEVHVHGVAHCILGDPAGGVGDYSTDLRGSAEHQWHRQRGM